MRRLLRPSLLVLGTTAALVGGGSVLAFAGWTSRTVSPTFTIHATPVPQVPKPTVTLIKVAPDRTEFEAQGPGTDPTATPKIQWTKVELTPDEDVSRYVVTRHAGPVAEVVCTLPGTNTPVCIDKTAPAGNVLTYTVAATYGTNWVGEDSEPSPAVTMPGTPVVATAGGVPVDPSASAVAPSVAPGDVPPTSGATADTAEPSAGPVTPPTTAPTTATPDTPPTTAEPTPPTTEPTAVATTTEPAPAESTAP